MELLDRYLNAVKRHLPWERQDDIIAELKANLEAQLEDKEAELGRKLGSDEMKAWIKELGPPIQVAARYQPQRYLIGPALFPTYSYVLRLVLTWVTVIYAIANAVAIAARNQGGEAVLQAVLRLPWIWLVNAAVTTLIFAVIEMTGARFPEKFRAFGWVPGSMTGPMTGPMTAPWSPLDLQPADLGDSQWFKPRSFTRALLEFFSGCLFLAYVLLIPHYPYLLFGPGEWYLRSLPYRLAPVWWTFYWLVVGVNTFELAWKVADLARDIEEGPWDIILWRNMAIYLTAEMNEFLWKRLASALVPGGVLIVGKAERPPSELPLSNVKRCIYRSCSCEGGRLSGLDRSE